MLFIHNQKYCSFSIKLFDSFMANPKPTLFGLNEIVKCLPFPPTKKMSIGFGVTRLVPWSRSEEPETLDFNLAN
jgi:hypothetical protein